MRSCSIILLAGTCLLIALGLEMTQAFRVDCTKFVFAPKCRGVSAKRRAAFPADIAFSDRRQRPDNPSSTGDFVVRRSDRPGTSLLRLRGRPNPPSAQDDLRQAIDRPNYFRTKREITESLDHHMRTKVASGGAGREGRGHLRTRDTSTGRDERGHLRTRDTSGGGTGGDDRGGQSSTVWAPRTIRRIFINRPEPLDLGQPKQIN